ncbi:uncharacterized protein LOC128676383 [Plodia interpunctella]|uniref:uncharacterized protein LOC128676383 n=1 Tax=Plodia interpunctella TaxID=58824 RepID=UPI002367B00F|nr:uncharacterized protein LOC128676383 [Plodia interpunctella]
MKLALVLAVCLLTFVCISECKDLIIGATFNNRLIWQHKVEYNAIPLKKRVKEEFYADPGQKTIKGIIARDMDHTRATSTVTAGGVGFSYVNLRFKSERGSALNYRVEVYV